MDVDIHTRRTNLSCSERWLMVSASTNLWWPLLQSHLLPYTLIVHPTTAHQMYSRLVVVSDTGLAQSEMKWAELMLTTNIINEQTSRLKHEHVSLQKNRHYFEWRRKYQRILFSNNGNNISVSRDGQTGTCHVRVVVRLSSITAKDEADATVHVYMVSLRKPNGT